MNKVIVTVAGVLLATGAATALAGSGDSEQLAQCKALVSTHFGDDARTRLRSVRSRADGTHMQLSVKPGDGSRHRLICSRDDQGISLTTRDGVALVPAADAPQTVSLAD